MRGSDSSPLFGSGLEGHHMNACPVTAFDDLRQVAIDHVRHQRDRWPGDRLVLLEHEMLYPAIPDRLQLGAESWTKVATPMVRFRIGLGLEVKTASDWKCTHFHGDLETESASLHIDYFAFATWGPVGGVLGFIVSRDGVILGGGGHWALPPGGGSRNWPLGVRVEPQQLLTAYSVRSTNEAFTQEGDDFLCGAITLWRKTDMEQTPGVILYHSLPDAEGKPMDQQRWHYQNAEYHRNRVVCLTVIPPYAQAEYALDPAVEAKVVKLLDSVGQNCRVSKFQWLIATDEACGAIVQDLGHEGVENVLVFSALVGSDWKFWCNPRGEADEWEFDGVAAFLQRLG